MQPPTSYDHWLFLRHNPLIFAAALFLTGVTLGAYWHTTLILSLAAAAILLLAWIIAELALAGAPRTCLAHITLAGAILLAGVALWQANQQAVEPNHIARFASDDGPVPVTARLRVLTPPESSTAHGNLFWIGSVTEIFTDHGWVPAAGDVRVKWRSGSAPELVRGQLVEVYAWLKRPDPALNPGAFDARQFLAADRLFAELRIPRAAGLIPLTNGYPGLAHPLTSFRLFLRGKLLEHTAKIDVEAGYSMAALLLGHRDPIIESISQAFAAAGVAHLIAISGAHLILFTVFVGAVLSLIPLRPRLREVAIVLVVLTYVIATPCGPPVLRAAIGIFIYMISRLLGRPRMLLNTLAAAAILIILLRPTDLFDAGFQLTFICTAGLILFFQRLNRLFDPWLFRQYMIADLAGNRWASFKLNLSKFLLGFATANFIGSTIAAPLVAFHFGFITPYAILSGLVAFPFIALTMAASALQLLLELASTALAALSAPISTAIARLMVWIVTHLAALPGAAVALRAPPPWLIALFYLVVLLWAIRRRLHASRALLLNAALAVLTLSAAWYLFTQPVGDLQITTLSAGQGSSILLRTPTGQTWLLNAGSRDAPQLLDRAIAPALRVAGVKQLDALLITSLDTVAASSAPQVIDCFHPPLVILSAIDVQHLGWTHTGSALEESIAAAHTHQVHLAAGACIDLGGGAQIRILSPDPSAPRPDLVLLLEFAHRRILLLDPANTLPLGLLELTQPPLHCDAIILLGPQRSPTIDAPLQKLLTAAAPQTIIWSGRTPRTPQSNPANTHNAADHALTLRISPTGILTTD